MSGPPQREPQRDDLKGDRSSLAEALRRQFRQLANCVAIRPTVAGQRPSRRRGETGRAFAPVMVQLTQRRFRRAIPQFGRWVWDALGWLHRWEGSSSYQVPEEFEVGPALREHLSLEL